MTTLRSPFVFPVADLVRSDTQPRHVEVVAPVEWGVELSRTLVDPPLTADLTLSHVSGGVLVRGTVTVTVRSACHRCLDDFEEEMDIEVAQLFVFDPDYDIDDPDAPDYEIEGDAIDLEPMLRDEVILAMPMLPSCGDECPGRVPGVVGDAETGLNTSAPVSERGSTSPFAVLQDLFHGDNDSSEVS